MTYRPHEEVDEGTGAPRSRSSSSRSRPTPRPGSPRRRWSRTLGRPGGAGGLRPRAVRPAGHRGGIHRGPGAVREHPGQRRGPRAAARSPRWSSTSARRSRRSGSPPRRAKWDEPYRERKGIRNVFARPIGEGCARHRIEEICRTAYRALWLRDYARLDVRLTADRGGLVPRGQRQSLHQLRPRHGQRGGEGGHGLSRVHPADRGRSVSAPWPTRKRREPLPRAGDALRLRPSAEALLALLPQLRPGPALGRHRPRDRRRVLPLRLGGLRQILLLSLVRRRHPRGGRLQRGAAQGAQGLPHGCPLRLGLRRRGAVPDALLSLVQPAADLERRTRSFEGDCPHCARGVDDWMNPVPGAARTPPAAT